ncbi:periplasmic heavy metal sensor [Anianabacter salinae]|uniref:periplasmic heavy metal sensor n=1 Tax=Anianabacter salinae TaxID=2851023 RepID=UPI00225E0429|nr:periplasmic heavy metal sensor [Anianabacter salinae]MBV0911395.1 periplasmic heavy metal sensor [Anianabacter salinae]
MTDTAPSKAPRWMRIALVLSLAVNLAVAGIVGGAVLRHDRDERGPRPSAVGLGPFADALSREDRMIVLQAFRREAGAFRENRSALRDQFETLLAALRADPYDPAVVRDIIAAQDAKLFERLTLGHDLLLERIDAMDDAARQAYAARLEDRLSRGGRRGPDERPEAGPAIDR